MKILHIVFFYYPAVQYGGPTVNVHNISTHLKNKGHQITIYCTNYMDYQQKLFNYSQTRKKDGFVIRYLNSWRLIPTNKGQHGFIICPDLLFSLDDDLKTFDIIHIHGYRNFLSLAISIKARLFRIPYVIQARGTLVRLTGNIVAKRFFDATFGHRILKNATKVIALNKREKYLYQDFDVDPNKIEIIPNGLDISNIKPKINAGEFRKRIGLTKNDKIILFLGRIHASKGIDLLIRSFAALDLEGVYLVIVGPDEGYLSKAQEIAKSSGLADNAIIFMGPIYDDEKYTVYHDADLFVLSSLSEGLPTSVIEALMCKTPVVITNKCGMTEQVHEKVGLVVDHHESELTAAIQTILENDTLRSHYKRNTHDVSQQFELSNVVGEIERLYFSITSNNNVSN